MDRKILITNDDGIDSDGIIRLAAAAQQFGEVWVVAPDSQRSAASHSITLRHSVRAWEVVFPVKGVRAFACDGTPADCVRIGHLNIVPGGADEVFSGINFGYNCATDLQYSATVGAAFEGSFQQVHSVAFSESGNGVHETTDDYLLQAIQEALEIKTGFGEIVNVNFPECRTEQCRGVMREVAVSRGRIFHDSYDEKELDGGVREYTVNGLYNPNPEEGTDLWALMNCYVAIGTARNVGV